jgi:hypothetical protein
MKIMNKITTGYIIIILTSVFMLCYLYDGIKEIIYPFQGLGYPYKHIYLYMLKLLYSVLLLMGGILLIKNKKAYWYFINFSSIGILVCTFRYCFWGYIFRTSPLDLFFLELCSLVFIIIFNFAYSANKINVFRPQNNWLLLFIFLIINILLLIIDKWILLNYYAT